MLRKRKFNVVTALGAAQLLAWSSSYYLPAILATAIAREFQVATPVIFAAFSLALVVSAFLGPWAGRFIDRHGGRNMLMATNVLFAAGLAVLGTAPNLLVLVLAWVLIGVAMGCGLYEAGFATLVRLYGMDSRSAITGITLIAGFSSTVGWPLTSLFEAQLGWRGACLAWATLHVLVAMPLNGSLPRASLINDPLINDPPPEDVPADPEALPQARAPRMATLVLSLVFAITWFTSTAMAAHMPQLMQAAGTTLAAAVAIGALIGPAQVAARLFEFSVLRHLHPLWSARCASLAHPLGVVVLAALGAPAAVAFTLLHGAGNGILTVAKGTLPLAIFGPHGYGLRQGWLSMPARIAQACAPFVFGVALDQWGVHALWITAALGVLAFAALQLLPVGAPRRPIAHQGR
jgi:predicted MFS family arabinose efflux permease